MNCRHLRVADRYHGELGDGIKPMPYRRKKESLNALPDGQCGNRDTVYERASKRGKSERFVAARKGSRGRFDPQERTVVLIRKQVQKPVGSFAHLTDALPELPQQRLAP